MLASQLVIRSWAALPPRRYLDCRCRDYACQDPSVTDQQFQLILRHLQVVIAILGVMAGVLIARALTYL